MDRTLSAELSAERPRVPERLFESTNWKGPTTDLPRTHPCKYLSICWAGIHLSDF